MIAPLRSALRRRAATRLRALASDRSGTSILEFAIVLPVLATLGMYGTELAYMATVNMQVSQLAMSVADNASRLGQTDNSAVTPSVTNADIDSVMAGAMEEGAAIDIAENGRIILSSLEQTSTGRQFIGWQRCRGALSKKSAYGEEGTGKTGAVLEGMGRGTQMVTANTNSAVMFAEVYYTYRGIFGTLFVGTPQFRQEAAFIIRDNRNLTAPNAAGSESPCS